VTIAIRPCVGRDGRSPKDDLPDGESKLFRAVGWTVKIRSMQFDLPVGQISGGELRAQAEQLQSRQIFMRVSVVHCRIVNTPPWRCAPSLPTRGRDKEGSKRPRFLIRPHQAAREIKKDVKIAPLLLSLPFMGRVAGRRPVGWGSVERRYNVFHDAGQIGIDIRIPETKNSEAL
jgi:hypothetical protein